MGVREGLSANLGLPAAGSCSGVPLDRARARAAGSTEQPSHILLPPTMPVRVRPFACALQVVRLASTAGKAAIVWQVSLWLVARGHALHAPTAMPRAHGRWTPSWPLICWCAGSV